MIDTATVSAIAEKTNSLIQNAQSFLIVLTSLVATAASLASYILGHKHGKKEAAKTNG